MFESRSKNWYDNESDGGTSSSSLEWYEFLLIPVLIIPFLLLFAIFEIVFFIAPFIHEFYSTAKRISETGQLEFPGLMVAGIVTAILLPAWIATHRFNVADHPFITFCASIFVLMFTLAPLTGLIMRYFKPTKLSSKTDDHHGC
jgi:hypothetical protein